MWYQYDEEKDGLVQHTHHFVAGEMEKKKEKKKDKDEGAKKGRTRYKADVKFVIAAWEALLESEWAAITSITVFSDGCSQQFKLMKYSIYLMWMTRQ